MKKCFPLFVFFLFVAQNVVYSQLRDAQEKRGLKDYFQNYFPIGVAVSPQSLAGDEAKLILKQFNSLTPENVMKPGSIHPAEDHYNWTGADEIVNFGQKHHLKVRGHTLCWHQQIGDWFFKDGDGNTVTKEKLLQRLKEHITSVVSRYKGNVYAWDVVNEAISDDSTQFLRDSPWFNICGEDFIEKAFTYAHEADPDAQLFYNEYNAERPEKRERIYRLLKRLVGKKVPIYGVGLQGHWSVFEPSEVDLRNAIEKFSSLGLKIQITELDVSIYKWEKLYRERRPDDRDLFTPELEQMQVEKYNMVFKVFRENKNVITGVTFWNISDKHSWLDTYPVMGRKNYPLLFDQHLEPKRAFWEIVKFDQ
jgi:endo-1,4-beta-xylanase